MTSSVCPVHTGEYLQKKKQGLPKINMGFHKRIPRNNCRNKRSMTYNFNKVPYVYYRDGTVVYLQSLYFLPTFGRQNPR